MTADGLTALARALLYEGYLLYPYRASSVKNRQRWMFGTLYPRTFVETQAEGDAWWLRAECLVRGRGDAILGVHVRFLELAATRTAEREADAPESTLGRLCDRPETTAFGAPPGAHGALTVGAEPAGEGLFKISVLVENRTAFAPDPNATREARRDTALHGAFTAAHVLLRVTGGAFLSLIDPPEIARAAAARCRNVGVWPVLVGAAGADDAMLAAPIVLDDHPRVAPESPGDFFDATEIDAMLTLRVLTLSDEEKAAVRTGDPLAAALLARTERLTDAERRRLIDGAARALRPGRRVRLTPRPGGDVFDLALAGRTATIVKLEEDYEGRRYVAVAVDDDPGRDLGIDGRPGHRFFFRPDEVELLP
ncbi:MAG TPA: hypothetical protein VEA38_07020 [Terriglobales bacterium]|nr:hypothetical protein [Terriglobales bacterium]